ncbi:TPT-domain-containing protein [Acephala macrosclerotiorum]|nr:TPT-domain-containing protein [Acephala macrosclerotiorum]
MSVEVLPTTEKAVQKRGLHPVFYIASWIFFSSVTILFNKYLLSNLEFHFPAILTCWHLLFSTIVTQILARTTTLLDSRHEVKMTGRVYLRAIVPIGILYSASLVCSNQAYLYLSVAFIQMLKASAPAAVLLVSWLFHVATPSLTVLLNVLLIVLGVTLASYGEVQFIVLGFIYQAGGIFAEAIRLIMIQILLSGDESKKMDPLVSLYYYAPVCTVMNGLVALVTEVGVGGEGGFVWADVGRVGWVVLVLNAEVAFLLNVASVFLIGKTSGLVMTLCGVLKNILLVVASILIWGTVVSGLQVVGYGIALVGLVYYGVGYEGMVTYYNGARDFAVEIWERSEGDKKEPQRSHLLRNVIIAGSICVVAVILLWGGMAMRNE